MKIARLLVLSTIAANAIAGTVDVPRAPLYREMPLPDEGNVRRDRFGDLSWIAAVPVSGTRGSKTDCWQWGLVVRHWNPATGDTSQRSLGLPGGMEFQLVAGRDTWFRSTTTCNDGAPVRIALMTPEKLIALSVSDAEGLRMERFVALSDDAIFAIQRDPSSLHPRGVVFRREGTHLVAQAMPELPIKYRGDYAIVALDDHRVMLLGGSDSDMRGCSGCRASTQILDTRASQWKSGPPMHEGRSEATAARLPDGSIIVAGGWTAADFWGAGPSRTAERWDPQHNVFEPLPPMPVGIARAQARWMPGRDGGTLLFVQGVSAGIPAFDVKTRSWYLAGAWTAGSIEAACAFFPFEKDGRLWAWQRFRTEGTYETRECASDRIALARMIEPRPPGGAAAGPPQAEAGTGQAEARFAPADGPHPALVVGGTMSIGANQAADSGAVTGVDSQGRLFGLPALNHARRVPDVVRIGDGVLVTGEATTPRPGANPRRCRPSGSRPPSVACRCTGRT